MPIFFSHLDNGHGFQRDEDGADFPDKDAARQSAVRAGAAILADEIREGCLEVKLTIYIEDADHHPVTSVPMTAKVGAN